MTAGCMVYKGRGIHQANPISKMLLMIGLLRYSLPLLLAALLCACNQDLTPRQLSSSYNGITDKEIIIGSSLALEGHAGYLGTQTLHGAMAYIHTINAAGGIYGRKIRVISYDDGYDPPRCVVNTQKLIVRDRVFALFCYVGTPTTVKIIPLVEEARIPLVGMFTGANALREPLSRYLINVRASYYQETGAAVRYLVETLNLRKIAVFYQYDAYGFDGLRGTELALKHHGLVPVATGSYVRGTLQVQEGLDKIEAADAQAVVMIGTYDPCALFIRLAKARGFNPVFYNVSFVGADELTRRLGKDAEGVIVTQVVPPPGTPGRRSPAVGSRRVCATTKGALPQRSTQFRGSGRLHQRQGACGGAQACRTDFKS